MKSIILLTSYLFAFSFCIFAQEKNDYTHSVKLGMVDALTGDLSLQYEYKFGQKAVLFHTSVFLPTNTS